MAEPGPTTGRGGEKNIAMYVEFMFGMTEDRVEEAQRALAAVGIDFNPHRHLIAVNQGLHADAAAQGHETRGLVERINRFLENAGMAPLPDADDSHWSLARRQQFLDFAVGNFNWRDGGIEDAWWEHEDNAWETRVKPEYPLVFPISEENAK